VIKSLEELRFVGDVPEIAAKRDQAERVFHAVLQAIDERDIDL
jgi:hypothetical protein